MAAEERQEDRPGQRAGQEQRTGGDDLGRHIADDAIAQPRDERGEQRTEDDD
ncbi:hypothetical protein HNP60_002193 [Sphingobium sp. B1D3A]|uniref:Uncharacterized protein n=1 Tax=Sphingobium lignivorans TaxID=2735886 RepID=A0ABR6NG05_9SPHN|nr:hypothetical protein [Sphingobium lignivorans]